MDGRREKGSAHRSGVTNPTKRKVAQTVPGPPLAGGYPGGTSTLFLWVIVVWQLSFAARCRVTTNAFRQSARFAAATTLRACGGSWVTRLAVAVRVRSTPCRRSWPMRYAASMPIDRACSRTANRRSRTQAGCSGVRRFWHCETSMIQHGRPIRAAGAQVPLAFLRSALHVRGAKPRGAAAAAHDDRRAERRAAVLTCWQRRRKTRSKFRVSSSSRLVAGIARGAGLQRWRPAPFGRIDCPGCQPGRQDVRLEARVGVRFRG